MGLMDMVKSMAGGGGQGGEHAGVAGGLVQELEQRPGGVSGVFQSFQQNGMGGLVRQWAGGQTQASTPGQMEQGLQGSGLIEQVAQRTGISPTMVKSGLALVLPLVIHHFASNGHVTPEGEQTGAPPPDSGNVLQSILGKMV